LFHAQSTVKEQTFVSPVFSDDKRIEVEPYQAASTCVFICFPFVLNKLGHSFLGKANNI
jgi:hypothetical protein